MKGISLLKNEKELIKEIPEIINQLKMKNE